MGKEAVSLDCVTAGRQLRVEEDRLEDSGRVTGVGWEDVEAGAQREQGTGRRVKTAQPAFSSAVWRGGWV